MTYRRIESQECIPELVAKLSKSCWDSDFKFLLSPGYHIYGWFDYEDSERYEPNYHFVYGQTLKPEDITPPAEETIFAKLKQYGSSRKYMGILNSKEEEILPREYTSIEHTGWRDFFVVGKKDKYGVFSLKNGWICPVEYDSIERIAECVFGVVKDLKIGYMDSTGKWVIPIGHDYFESFQNFFEDGTVPIYTQEENHIKVELTDHHGNIIEEYRIDNQ